MTLIGNQTPVAQSVMIELHFVSRIENSNFSKIMKFLTILMPLKLI